VPLEVLAFGDEEGSRFPSTLSSSSACVGAFEQETLAFADRQGVTFVEALKAYGKDLADILKAAYKPSDVRGYVEVHIEQGPLLEAENEPLGVVTGIVGQSRFRVTVTGEAGHAGTVPMRMRRDALAGAAEMTLLAERIGRAGHEMVATVGRLEVSPGATNIIPAKVMFTVDLRSMDDGARHAAIAQFEKEARGIADARRLGIDIEHFHAVDVVPCDARLQELLIAAIGDGGGRAVRLPSGAGHDAQVMARLCPAAMMFVRCKGGVSHNPAEYTSPADMGRAVAALIRFIVRFASQ
jgi:allantoate deiminase